MNSVILGDRLVRPKATVFEIVIVGSNPTPLAKIWVLPPSAVCKTVTLRDGKSGSWSVTISTHHILALLVKWYNDGFVIRSWQFDSVKGHQISECSAVW